jgi:hypothetical protein
VATYLLTASGHQHFRDSQNDQQYTDFLLSNAEVGLQTMATVFDIDYDAVLEVFHFYLSSMPIRPSGIPHEWDNFPPFLEIRSPRTQDESDRRQAGELSLATGCTPTAAFVEIGQRMATFPATECCCERLFCNVRNVVGDFRHAMKPETLRDLMTIRMDVIWAGEKKSQDMWEVGSRLYTSINNHPEEPEVPFQIDDSGI